MSASKRQRKARSAQRQATRSLANWPARERASYVRSRTRYWAGWHGWAVEMAQSGAGL